MMLNSTSLLVLVAVSIGNATANFGAPCDALGVSTVPALEREALGRNGTRPVGVGKRRNVTRTGDKDAMLTVTVSSVEDMPMMTRGSPRRGGGKLRPTSEPHTTDSNRQGNGEQGNGRRQRKDRRQGNGRRQGTGRRQGNGTAPSPNESAFELKDTITKYSVPPIVGIGIIANCLSLLALQRKPLRNVPSVYFTAVAFADTLALVEFALTTYLRRHMEVELYTTRVALCKVLKLLKQFSPTWSAWLIVAMTTERLLAVSFPLKLKFWFSRAKAAISAMTITGFLLGLWSFFAFAQRVSMCSEGRAEGPYEYIDRHLYLALYTGAPSPILLLLNGLLLFQMFKARKAQKQMAATRAIGLSRATVSTLVVSVVYVVLTLPSYVLGYYKSYILGRVVLSDALVITSQVFKVLHYLNHAVNCFLYLALLPKFRAELVTLLTCGRRTLCRQGTASSATSSFRMSFSNVLSKKDETQDEEMKTSPNASGSSIIDTAE